ncbi:DUF4030 domain-containing protein [Neobacillus sp. NRS-1170]|uniref:DUF4030 domain-containing protein n=1 Tax=Neobacillus sp. NRS-1170 TaxID=3233898 RepID=UPI003D285BCE
MEKDLKEVKDYYQQNYFHDEIANRIKDRVQQQIQPKRINWWRRLFYFSGAAVAAFGVFVVLAFFSPAVAEVAAKVPFLNMIFKSQPISDVILTTLTEKGYKVDGIGVRYEPKKVMSVRLQGTEEEVNKDKPEVKKIVKDLLLSRGFDAYGVRVEASQFTPPVLSEEEQKIEELNKQVFDVVSNVLKSYGNEEPIGLANKTIEINLPNTETKKDEIKQKIQSQLAEKGLGTFTVNAVVYNVKKREREMRWSDIITTIADGMFSSKKYKVIGVGYTNRSAEFMQITISTSVSSKDADYEEVTDRIEDTIREFLTSKETKEIIKDDAYKVFIRSKDKKERVITR